MAFIYIHFASTPAKKAYANKCFQCCLYTQCHNLAEWVGRTGKFLYIIVSSIYAWVTFSGQHIWDPVPDLFIIHQCYFSKKHTSLFGCVKLAIFLSRGWRHHYTKHYLGWFLWAEVSTGFSGASGIMFSFTFPPFSCSFFPFHGEQ